MDELRVYEDIFQVDFTKVPMNAKYAGVIVEPRKHEHLSLVLKNFVYMLPDWSLYIFHSKENEQFIQDILGPNHTVNMIQFTDGNIDLQQYNALLTSLSFYDRINAEKILVFQCDSFIRKKDITPFLSYDYVGAPWAPGILPLKIKGNPIAVGNGGLSLRSVSVMKHIINTFTPIKGNMNEDVFFAVCTILMNGCKRCPEDIAKAFSVETVHHPDPFGWHKAYCYHKGSNWDMLKSINLT